MTFEFFNTIFHRARWKQNQPFTFWYCVDNFYPWKDIVAKKLSKLRSIAELRAFYGILRVLFITLTFFISSSKSVCLHAHVKERMSNKRKKTLVYYVSYSLHLLFWYSPLNLFVYMRPSKRECATREKKHKYVMCPIHYTYFLISSSKSVCLHAHVKKRMCNKRKKH